jgi:hypothetical protein
MCRLSRRASEIYFEPTREVRTGDSNPNILKGRLFSSPPAEEVPFLKIECPLI